MMRKTIFKICMVSLFFAAAAASHAVSLSSIQESLCDSFYGTEDDNEGVFGFRSLLIPFGGRTESLGLAYTGLCDDINYLQYNPAGASVQGETQFSLFHNSWIADSKMETLAFTSRGKNLTNFGFGSYISCFYVPFSEYNIFGEKTASSYYSETTGALNFSYNFLSGYDFKGLCVGANIKASYRSVPDYTDDDTNEIIPGSGLSQSGAAFMADAGLLLQFNFMKFYASREPNLRFGLSIKNAGIAFTGFKDEIKTDDPLPTTLNAGFSIRLIKPFLLTAEYSQPVNLTDFSQFYHPYIGGGLSVQFSNYVSMMAGFALKGGNPRFSAGFEFEYEKLRLNMNYTLDFTTSTTPLNRISLSAKILLGDKGRKQAEEKIDEYYRLGLSYYSEGQWEKAIEVWQEALKLNSRFAPAILGIKTAKLQIEMFENIKKSLLLE